MRINWQLVAAFIAGTCVLLVRRVHAQACPTPQPVVVNLNTSSLYVLSPVVYTCNPQTARWDVTITLTRVSPQVPGGTASLQIRSSSLTEFAALGKVEVLVLNAAPLNGLPLIGDSVDIFIPANQRISSLGGFTAKNGNQSAINYDPINPTTDALSEFSNQPWVAISLREAFIEGPVDNDIDPFTLQPRPAVVESYLLNVLDAAGSIYANVSTWSMGRLESRQGSIFGTYNVRQTFPAVNEFEIPGTIWAVNGNLGAPTTGPNADARGGFFLGTNKGIGTIETNSFWGSITAGQFTLAPLPTSAPTAEPTAPSGWGKGRLRRLWINGDLNGTIRAHQLGERTPNEYDNLTAPDRFNPAAFVRGTLNGKIIIGRKTDFDWRPTFPNPAPNGPLTTTPVPGIEGELQIGAVGAEGGVFAFGEEAAASRVRERDKRTAAQLGDVAESDFFGGAVAVGRHTLHAEDSRPNLAQTGLVNDLRLVQPLTQRCAVRLRHYGTIRRQGTGPLLSIQLSYLPDGATVPITIDGSTYWDVPTIAPRGAFVARDASQGVPNFLPPYGNSTESNTPRASRSRDVVLRRNTVPVPAGSRHQFVITPGAALFQEGIARSLAVAPWTVTIGQCSLADIASPGPVVGGDNELTADVSYCSFLGSAPMIRVPTLQVRAPSWAAMAS